MYYTYAHYKPDGTIFYIGKGSKNRAYSKSGRNDYWHQTVKKHKSFLVKILALWETEEEAFQHEIVLIDSFKFIQIKLVNMSLGGEGFSGLTAWNKGKQLSEEHKEALSKSHKNKPWTEKQRVSQNNAKQKQSQSLKIAMARPETKEKHRIAVSLAKKGKKQTEEQKLNTSIAIKAWWAKRKETV